MMHMNIAPNMLMPAQKLHPKGEHIERFVPTLRRNQSGIEESVSSLMREFTKMQLDAAALKEEANAEFKKENYLSAAALFTKAIRLDPGNHLLYSNRSAALLKLQKVHKALEDAEACVKLKPDFVKGYCRMAAVFVSMEKHEKVCHHHLRCMNIMRVYHLAGPRGLYNSTKQEPGP